MYDYTQEHNRTGGVMVSVLAVSAVERASALDMFVYIWKYYEWLHYFKFFQILQLNIKSLINIQI
jgi:hypothetical protein